MYLFYTSKKPAEGGAILDWVNYQIFRILHRQTSGEPIILKNIRTLF